MRRIIRFPEVRSLVGLGRTSVWEMERAGKFPARVHLTDTAVGWYEDEVLQWIESRRATC